MGLGDDFFNQPFVEQPVENFDLNTVLAGALVVQAGVIAGDDGVKHPLLVFRFFGPGEEALPPITLVLDQDHMRGLPDLMKKAAHAAIRESRKHG